jgi:hypothetical protein
VWRKLREEVEDELSLLARSISDTAVQRSALLASPNPPDSWSTRAAAAAVNECYMGMERILKRMAKSVDRSMPTGPSWHADLLAQLSEPTPSRPALVSPDLAHGLKGALAFRHMARMHYGFELEWRRLRPHLEALPHVVETFSAAARAFLDELDRRHRGDRR